MRRNELISDTARRFAAAGIESPRLEAEMLLGYVLGMERHGLYLDPNKEVGRAACDRYAKLAARRLAGAPVHYLTHQKEFMGLPFYVDRSVLIPRFDTEVLAEAVLHWLRANPQRRTLADIGTGSGALAVSLAYLVPDLRVMAVDRSRGALRVTERNAEAHGVAGRVTLCHGDLVSLLSRVDALVSNPPYIRDAELPDTGEPRMALSGGPDGLRFYRRLAAESPGVLPQGGLFAVEVGYDQAADVMDILGKTGHFTDIRSIPDLAGIQRVVTACKF